MSSDSQSSDSPPAQDIYTVTDQADLDAFFELCHKAGHEIAHEECVSEGGGISEGGSTGTPVQWSDKLKIGGKIGGHLTQARSRELYGVDTLTRWILECPEEVIEAAKKLLRANAEAVANNRMERLDVYMTIGMVHALADSGDKTKGNGTTNKQVRLFGTQVSINKEMLMKILDNDVARYNALKKGLVRIAVAEPGETHVSAYINGENLDGIPDIIWQEAERIAIVISPDPADNTRDRENWELYNRIKPRRNGQKKLVAFCALVAALSDGKVPRLDDDDDLNERATITAERRISGAKKRQAEADAAAREAKRKW